LTILNPSQNPIKKPSISKEIISPILIFALSPTPLGLCPRGGTEGVIGVEEVWICRFCLNSGQGNYCDSQGWFYVRQGNNCPYFEPIAPKIINLTPHPINIIRGDQKITIPPSGKVARVQPKQQVVGFINVQDTEIPIVRTEFGEVQGLPEEPEPNTIYIVSTIVLQAIANNPELAEKFRGKVVAPDTSPSGAVRDEQGRIIGVKGFQIL